MHIGKTQSSGPAGRSQPKFWMVAVEVEIQSGWSMMISSLSGILK